jgi:hypothetical protein
MEMGFALLALATISNFSGNASYPFNCPKKQYMVVLMAQVERSQVYLEFA